MHMNRCSQCGAEITESETICDRCAYEAADPVEGQPSLQSVLAQAAPSASAVGAPPRPASAGTKRVLGFAVLGVVAFAGTLTLARLGSEAPASPESVSVDPSTASRPAVEASAAAGTPKWQSNAEWVGFQKRAVAFELPANNKVPVWLRQAHPYLVVRCIGKRLDAFVYMESTAQIEPQDERHTVRLRVDDAPEVTERWQDSDEHDALFAPDGVAFAQRLTRAQVLRVGYRPHNAAPVVAEFNVGGLSEVIAPFAAQCGWKK